MNIKQLIMISILHIEVVCSRRGRAHTFLSFASAVFSEGSLVYEAATTHSTKFLCYGKGIIVEGHEAIIWSPHKSGG